MVRDLDCMLGGGDLEFHVLNHFNGCCSCMRSSTVMMQNNFIFQNSSVFTANSRLQLIFKRSTIPIHYCLSVHDPGSAQG